MNIQLGKKNNSGGKLVGCNIHVAPDELPDFLETIDAAAGDPDKLGAFIGTQGAGALSTPSFYVTFLDIELGKRAASLLS
ncbi:hypothetical protein [Glutamicibacter sp. FBE19]|uniref:hypothetical protein n=1 Tax=Glutamicibacter sp. FBE19 TaxID=2761534 RepID=UPI001896942E|nr:hypothetical protein [Glutamicibacter sp. FBE19]MBF6671160.1 hypothetical protein [Glutamicibacter sp. FBE19]